ncbi:MAG: endolytic transglycosylase MltG [Streptococcaceae bacterium]|nr:endolytic transglycosylase MltG [Streptococcaceae bacterium]
MTDENNSENLHPGDLGAGFPNQTENDATGLGMPQLGTVNFAARDVPDDILTAFAEASNEQSITTPQNLDVTPHHLPNLSAFEQEPAQVLPQTGTTPSADSLNDASARDFLASLAARNNAAAAHTDTPKPAAPSPQPGNDLAAMSTEKRQGMQDYFTKLNELKNYDADNHSLKINTINFLNGKPEAGKPQSTTPSAHPTQVSQSVQFGQPAQPIQQAQPAQPTTPAAQVAAVRNEARDRALNNLNAMATESSDPVASETSFKDQIMARLAQDDPDIPAQATPQVNPQQPLRSRAPEPPQPRPSISLNPDGTFTQTFQQSQTMSIGGTQGGPSFEFAPNLESVSPVTPAEPASQSVEDRHKAFVNPAPDEARRTAAEEARRNPLSNYRPRPSASDEDEDERQATKRLPRTGRDRKDDDEKPTTMSRAAKGYEGKIVTRDTSNRKRKKQRQSQSESSHKDPRQRGLGRPIAAVVIILLLALGGGGYYVVNGSLKAVDPSNKTMQTVNIPQGATAGKISSLLQSKHLIHNSLIFEYYAKLMGIGNFKSGYYSLNEAMDAKTIAQTISGGGSATSPAVGKITIPEGYTIDQMSTAFTINAASGSSASKSPFTASEFLKVVKDPTFIAQMKAKYPTLFASLPSATSGVKYQLEGYLFPATYDYNAQTTAKDIIEEMIAKEDSVLQPYYSQLKAKSLSVNDLLTLASIVEKEANSQSDRQQVAEVFLNRLNQNMPISSNVPLLYAEGKLGNSTAVDDANVDTSMNSPYNDYANTALPPGPVDSPSQISIDSVINHATNDYMYFCANPKTGQLYFATTLDEQNANIAKYVTPNE